MRHGRHHEYRIGSTPAHRLSILRNLAVGLISNGKIKTTATRSKALRTFVEKLVTVARTDTVANRRLVQSRINNPDAVKHLFENVAPKFKTRPGGYTRILKLADRRLGDGAPMNLIEFVE